ncbi:MAG TPA: hypothetical protein EYN66_19070 [Myxococcales bacterium]|nr:hypothetical protein [Myxococcales bacterium]
MGVVMEIDAASLAGIQETKIYNYYNPFNIGFKGGGGTTGTFNASHTYGGLPSGATYAVTAPGKYTQIGVFDGVNTTTLYVNGVAQATYVSAAGSSDTTITQLRNEYLKTMKFGDMFFKGGALDAGEALMLHNYWAEKFGF